MFLAFQSLKTPAVNVTFAKKGKGFIVNGTLPSGELIVKKKLVGAEDPVARVKNMVVTAMCQANTLPKFTQVTWQ